MCITRVPINIIKSRLAVSVYSLIHNTRTCEYTGAFTSTCAATSIRKKLHTDQIRVIFAFISLRTHNDNLSLSLSLSLFFVPTYLSLCVNQTSNNTMGLKRKKRGKKTNQLHRVVRVSINRARNSTTGLFQAVLD